MVTYIVVFVPFGKLVRPSAWPVDALPDRDSCGWHWETTGLVQKLGEWSVTVWDSESSGPKNRLGKVNKLRPSSLCTSYRSAPREASYWVGLYA